MVLMGRVKEVFVEDGQIFCAVETGTNQTVTAFVAGTAGSESHPFRGDLVVCQYTSGQDIVVSGVWTMETQTDPGETILFARNTSREIVASIHLHTDGSILCANDIGEFELKANGQVSLNGHLTVDP